MNTIIKISFFTTRLKITLKKNISHFNTLPIIVFRKTLRHPAYIVNLIVQK